MDSIDLTLPKSPSEAKDRFQVRLDACQMRTDNEVAPSAGSASLPLSTAVGRWSLRLPPPLLYGQSPISLSRFTVPYVPLPPQFCPRTTNQKPLPMLGVPTCSSDVVVRLSSRQPSEHPTKLPLLLRQVRSPWTMS